MSYPIALLRDDFTNNTQDPVWASSFVTGSATKAETGGQAILTLPSSTAGSHVAAYTTPGTYDLTGDGFYWNIGTMVATGVAATAYLQLLAALDGTSQLLWRQLSNAITARYITAAGVDTQLYTATWSSSTYKYLRIREAGGTIFWDSSSNGTSWTNRASVANPFAITALYVQFAASCGNVASPGSLRLDDVNLILPAPSSTWRYTTADWSISNRLMPVTLASTSNAQGVLVTADTMDSAGTLGGTLRYFAGPLGSSSGGYLQLTEYASLALAQASAFPVPVDGRVDLPAMVDARYMRLYHRSTDASAHTLREFVPRRIVQAEDIEAESIEAINIAAGAVTADKIFVLTLGAITANIGKLNIDTTGYLYQGTGTGDAPTTGLKIFNSSGIGKLSTYNAGVEQVTFDTDGRLKAGAGSTRLDVNGISLATVTTGTFDKPTALSWYDPTFASVQNYIWCETEPGAQTMNIISHRNGAGTKIGLIVLRGEGTLGDAEITLNGANAGSPFVNISATTTVQGGINVGSLTTGAGDGQIRTSGSVGIGAAVQGTVRAYVKGATANNTAYAIFADNSTPTMEFYVRNDGAGYLNAASWTLSSDERLKEKIVKSDRGLSHLKLIQAKKFDYKNGPKEQHGFLAADVQAIMPELVAPIDSNDTSPTPMLGMLTGNLIPILVSAVQELDARLTALEKK